ncbi:Transposase-like protein [Acidiphilium cryptum JF-5]|uniref:Transposase-like protein n=1 Tax=Acidiphilium cryptum (strain JF-5) TaxID=349163 RepID=A5FVI3_ACICJ|nr:Transposase-like protein [Acidiphilium cryptum JF-5]
MFHSRVAADAVCCVGDIEGTNGARLHDRAWCGHANPDAEDHDETKTDLWARGLLMRRNISDGDLAFLPIWCSVGASIQVPGCLEGHPWAIKTTSRPRRTNSALTTTRPGPGTSGIATSRS